ncbi:MAG: hypothetical protein LLG14_20650 [Nocardiaceae bacterium]|nr:hypothetical protein [Nocardiaceae bacterium]
MTSLQDTARKTIDAARVRALAVYDDLAARGEVALDGARRFAEERAENLEAALQARLEGARTGLGGRIRQ